MKTLAGGSAKAAADHQETQPVDIATLETPETLPRSASPHVSTEKLREQYQGSRPENPAAPVASAAVDGELVATSRAQTFFCYIYI